MTPRTLEALFTNVSRRGLSASLNFRARTDVNTSMYTRLHQHVSTALGKRPCFTNIVRSLLLAPTSSNLEATLAKLRTMESAPGYLILCSPTEAAIVEKDYETAHIRTSTSFLPCANHDAALDEWTPEKFADWANATADPLLVCSRDRKECVIDAARHVKTVEDIKKLTQTWPALNTLTTFGVIMSPERGVIDWGAWYKERPVPPSGMEEWGGAFTPIP